MSRHRNVRSMNYEEEYDGYDDVYGHSVEDDYCVSPATASQFLYDRGTGQNLSSYMQEDKIPEEDETQLSDEDSDPLQDSSSSLRPTLSDIDQARLNSCLEEVRNIIGDATPESVLIDVIISSDFDHEKALNAILSQQEAPKPQRQPRQRRERDYEESNFIVECSVDSQLHQPPSQSSDPSLYFPKTKSIKDSNDNDELQYSGKMLHINKDGKSIPTLPPYNEEKRLQNVNESSFGKGESPIRLTFSPTCLSRQSPNMSPAFASNHGTRFVFGTPPSSNLQKSSNIQTVAADALQSSQEMLQTCDKVTDEKVPKNSSTGSLSLKDLATHHISVVSSSQENKEQVIPLSNVSGSMIKGIRKISADSEKTCGPKDCGPIGKENQGDSKASAKNITNVQGSVSLADLAKQSSKKVSAPGAAVKKSQGLSLAELACQQSKGSNISGQKEKEHSGGNLLAGVPQGLSLADLARQQSSSKANSLQSQVLVHSGQQAGTEVVKQSKDSDKKISLAELAANFSKITGPSSQKDEPLSSSRLLDNQDASTKHSLPTKEGFIKPPPGFEKTKPQTVVKNPPPGFSPVNLSQLAASHSSKLRRENEEQPARNEQAFNKILVEKKTDVPVVSTSASIFANAFCSSISKKSHCPSRKHNNFSYKCQKILGGAGSDTLTFKNTITPFDFSTPSPDDIVKEKQKGAFLRTGGRASSTAISEKIPTSKPTNIDPSKPAQPVAQSEVLASSGVSSGVARMTFTTGTKTQSGFTPEKSGDCVDFGAVESVKNDLSKRIDGNGDKKTLVENGETDSLPINVLSTPKKSSIVGESAAVSLTPKSAVKVKRDPAAIRREYEKRKAEGKEYINLVVIGHVDAGKSTLMGHVLYQLGFVNKRTMHKYEQDSKKLGKASFAYAWVLDETEEERSRGVTMDVAQTRFQTETKIVTLLDAPGHKDFIPNMITGAAQADVGILVVNSTRGEFETGFDAGGQTREHAMLVRSLGVSQLIVAVNKMDTVDWSKDRFGEITKKLGQFLKQAGFKESDVAYVPCSGLSGENLTKAATADALTQWYSGPCIVQLIDNLSPPERQFDRPLRQCITDVFKGMGAGISVCGTLQAGSIQAGDKVLIMPQGETANVKSVSIDEMPVDFAFAGDNATIVLTGIDMTNLAIGSIVCDPTFPIQIASRLRARVVVFNIDLPITKGFPVVFHYQSLSEPAVIRKLVSQLHKSSGEIIKKKPRCLTKNSSAVVELELDRAVCIELYKDFKDLGRFMLRYSGATIAAGLVTEILSAKSKNE